MCWHCALWPRVSVLDSTPGRQFNTHGLRFPSACDDKKEMEEKEEKVEVERKEEYGKEKNGKEEVKDQVGLGRRKGRCGDGGGRTG